MRRLVLIIALILTVFGLLITFSPYLLRLFGLDVPVKQYFVKKVFKDDSHTFEADNLYIGLNKLEISDIIYVSGDNNIQIEVEKIRLSFNFWKLWSNPSQPQQALKNIYLLKPTLVINQTKDPREQDRRDFHMLDEEILDRISDIKSIGRIQIREGQVQWKKVDGSSVSIAQDISGWLDTKDFTDIQLIASGKIFNDDRNNINFAAKINIPDKRFHSEIQFDRYKASTHTLHELYEDIPINDGEINGLLEVENRGFILDSTIVNGRIAVNELCFTYNDADVKNMNFTVVIRDNHLSINEAIGQFQTESSFQLDVLIKNIFKPHIQADIYARQFPLGFFNNYMKQIQFNGSTANLDVHFELAGGKPSLKGQIFSKEIMLFKDIFRNFKLYFNWENSSLDVDYFTANWHNISFSGNSRYNKDTKHLKLNANGFQHLTEHVIFDRISNKIQKFNLSLDYVTTTKALSGNWYYSLAQSQDTVLLVSGDIEGDNGLLVMKSKESSASKLSARIEIDNYLTVPTLALAKINNVPVDLFTTAPVIQDIFRNIDTEIALKGSLNRLKGHIHIATTGQSLPLFRLDTQIDNLFKDNRSFKGNIDLKNLAGNYEFVFSDQFLGGDFTFNDEIRGEVYVDITKKEQLYGQVILDEFKVVRAITDSAYADDFRLMGSLNGLIEITGTVYDPKIKGKIQAEKFVFNDIGYYQGEFNFKADRTDLLTDHISISLNNSPLLNGNLHWTLPNNQVNGKVTGTDIYLADLLTTFNISDRTLTGTGFYDLMISGNISHPQLHGNLEIKDGTLKTVPFDQFQIEFTDIIQPDGSLFSISDHYISLENFFIAQQGKFHLHGLGKLPLNKQDEMDLALNFDGDLLGLIHYWQPFFYDGVSLVDLNAKIAGTSDNIQLKSAEINIERGELWLRKVAPHIEDIQGKIILKEGSNQIDFIDCRASVDNQTLFINTVRDISTQSGRVLEHWYFEDINLDFGILALETSDRGVELNIPGLMLKNESGKFHLAGKAENETFYLAGPVKHPLGYGTVTGYNTRLTFPFIETGPPDQKPSIVIQFLMNMEWDVDARVGENVLYFRDIPGYIDNVQAEVYVDESSEGLTFNGILDDGSFNTVGSLVSTRGRLEYLDQNFKVDRFTLEFNERDLFPYVSGKAWTTIRDSAGAIPKTIYLQLYVIDSETGQQRQTGNWEDFKFKLVSADPQIGETQEQVLAYMGYSVDNIREKATSVGGAMTEKYLIRPLLRPIERVLERSLGMDMVRFNSSIAKNLFYGSMGSQTNLSDPKAQLNPFLTSAPYLFLMQSSEVTLGKYLTQDIYLTYTGQLVSVYDPVESGFDMNHSLGLEYRFLRNILLEIEYDRELMGFYRILNEKQYMEDFKIRLRHSFSF